MPPKELLIGGRWSPATLQVELARAGLDGLAVEELVYSGPNRR